MLRYDGTIVSGYQHGRSSNIYPSTYSTRKSGFGTINGTTVDVSKSSTKNVISNLGNLGRVDWASKYAY